MGNKGASSGKSSGGGSYTDRVNSLENPKKSTVFADSKVNPLKYDNSKLMEVNFGDWQTEENLLGVQNVPISKIYTTQPYVQSSKLLNMSGSKIIDTSDIPALQIGNRIYISDGNHRTVSAILKGKKTIRLKVYKEK